MGKKRRVETSHEGTSKKVLGNDDFSLSVPPSTPSDPSDRPCSSLAVLKYYLTTLLGTYETAISIFKHLTPGDALRWMLTSKDMREILSRDWKLLRLLVDKHCIIRKAPHIVTGFQPLFYDPLYFYEFSKRTQIHGYQCASCYYFPHVSSLSSLR